MKEDKVEEVPVIDETKLECKHPFDILEQEENGLWMCECDTIGTLSADVHKKLTYRPQRVRYNRANIRREIKSTMKRLKSERKLPKY